MIPMTTDFALRLNFGLAAMLLATSPRLVPGAFFRILALIVLGGFVGGLLAGWSDLDRSMRGVLIAGAVLAYLASAFWGLGLVRLAAPITVAILAIAGWSLVASSWPGPSAGRAVVPAFQVAARWGSSLVIGSTLAAMLLGHHYLTSPSMSIAPLERFVRVMAWTLGGRAVLAAIGLGWAWQGGLLAASSTMLFLAMRWGMGIVGPAVATGLSWHTARLRSTQSATGILYIAITLVLFGELSGMILGRSTGIEL